MSPGVYLAVCVVLVVASTVQSSAGFGHGLVAAPVLRLLHPELLPGPIVVAGLAVAIGVARRNSTRADLPEMVPALSGRVVGNGAAFVLLAVLSDRGLSIAIGATVLAFVGLRWVGVGVPRTNRSLAGAGVVSGVGGTIAALGGAPMALLYEQHASARNFRGPMGWYTLFGGSLSVLTLALAGEYDADAIRDAALLLPPIAVGSYLSRWGTPLLDRGYLRPLVLGLSATSAALLVAGEIL